jgi:transcriptional regulator
LFIPDIYKNENQEEINDFLEKNSFGILINQTDGKLWATHIPLVLDINKTENKFYLDIFRKKTHNGKALLIMMKF